MFSYSAAISACAKGRKWQETLAPRPRSPCPPLAILRDHPGLPRDAVLDPVPEILRGRPARAGARLAQLLRPVEGSGSRRAPPARPGARRLRAPQEALDLLAEMPLQGVEPNAFSFSAAISACEKEGQWQQALGVLSAMQHAKLPPNVVAYSAAISACEKAGQRIRHHVHATSSYYNAQRSKMRLFCT